MVSTDPEPSPSEITELRNAILEKISSDGEDSFHPKDLERVKETDDWLRRFLMHTDLKQAEALQMLYNTLQWRKEYGTNELQPKVDILLAGGFFPRGKDIDGAPLFIFKCKKYVKNQFNGDEIRKCVIYWMERLERENNGNPITLFFDMEGCGLSNMDLDFTKYLIGLFKEYYPYFLNYVLVYEMPWVLSAAFKIIKSWLPEKAVKKIKFVSKKDLKDWVPMDQALKCWGGEDDYTFSFIPDSSENENNLNHNNNKKVRFEDGTQMSDVGSTITSAGEDGALLSVKPEGTIKFREQDNEIISNLILQNITSTPISYKVKTTSPEKFRVRPGYGCLNPGTEANVTICLLPAYKDSNVAKDKFLILSTIVENPDLNSDELTNLWKNNPTKKENQIHLRCSPLGDPTKNGSILQARTSEKEQTFVKISGTIQDLIRTQQENHNNLKTMLNIQFALIVVLIAAVIYVIITTQKNQQIPNISQP